MNKPTLAKARQMVRKANPGVKNLAVSWDHKPTLCTGYPASYKFWSAVVSVSADGYRGKRMVMTVDSEGSQIK